MIRSTVLMRAARGGGAAERPVLAYDLVRVYSNTRTTSTPCFSEMDVIHEISTNISLINRIILTYHGG